MESCSEVFVAYSTTSRAGNDFFHPMRQIAVFGPTISFAVGINLFVLHLISTRYTKKEEYNDMTLR